MSSIILDTLSTAVIALDEQYRVQYMNSAAELMLDTSYRRTQGHPIFEMMDAEDFQSDLHRVTIGWHQYTRREATLHLCDDRHNQTNIVVDYSVTPLDGPEIDDSKIDGLKRGLVIEMWQRNRLQRITREESLLAKQETSRNMMRGLAHEIKNPLGGIRGAAQLLSQELLSQELLSQKLSSKERLKKQTKKTSAAMTHSHMTHSHMPHSNTPLPELTEFTDIIIQEVDRLRDLVDKMLEPLQPPHIMDTNIHQVLDRVTQLIAAETEGVLTLVKDYDPSIPAIPGDAERLIQAILNIVRNAMQAIEQSMVLSFGVITIRTRITRQFTIGTQCPQPVCHIAVIDNGPGIPTHMIDSIFFPMISGRSNGSGLGLPLSQSIISQHRGLIECESQPSSTTFHIYLPLINHSVDSKGALSHEDKK